MVFILYQSSLKITYASNFIIIITLCSNSLILLFLVTNALHWSLSPEWICGIYIIFYSLLKRFSVFTVFHTRMNHRDVWINSDSESIPIQFSIFCEFWVESETEEAEVNWVWIESSMCWIESELNLSIVKSKWIESELHCQESWPKQIKITSSKI